MQNNPVNSGINYRDFTAKNGNLGILAGKNIDYEKKIEQKQKTDYKINKNLEFTYATLAQNDQEASSITNNATNLESQDKITAKANNLLVIACVILRFTPYYFAFYTDLFCLIAIFAS